MLKKMGNTPTTVAVRQPSTTTANMVSHSVSLPRKNDNKTECKTIPCIEAMTSVTHGSEMQLKPDKLPTFLSALWALGAE